MLRTLLATLTCALLAIQGTGAPTDKADRAPEVLIWRGCGISKKAFMAHVAKVYERKTGVRIELIGGGAALGIQAAGEGAADFGGSCRQCLSEGDEAELPLALTQVAWDALVVAVHPSNPVGGLTRTQLVDVLKGKVSNWSELGGEDLPVLVVARKGKVSGVGFMVRTLVVGDEDFEFGPRTLRLLSSGPVEELLEKSRAAIAMTGVSSARLRELKLLSLDGVEPEAEAIATGDYPYFRPMYLAHALELGPAQQRFRDWLLGDEGQAAVAAAGTVNLAEGVALTGRFAHYGDTASITNHAELQAAHEAWKREQEEAGPKPVPEPESGG